MNLWKTIKVTAGRLLKSPVPDTQPNQSFMYWNEFSRSKNKNFQRHILPKVPTANQLRNFSRNAIVRKPMNAIEDTISRLPYRLVNIDPNNDNDYHEEKRIAMNVIDHPNIIHNRRRFFKMLLEDSLVLDQMAFEKKLSGDTSHPLYLFPTDGNSIQFVVPYDYVDPNAARYMQQQQDGMHYYSDKQLALVKRNEFTDRPQGLSPLLTAYNYITYLLNANERADGVASNATSDFLLHFRNMPDKTREEFISYMQNEIEGTGVIPVSAGPDDVQSVQIRAINKDSFCIDWQHFLMTVVALAFNYPPQKMGVLLANDRSTAQDLEEMILSECVKPYADLMADTMNEHVLATLGYDKLFRFEFIYEDNEATKTSKSNRLTKELTLGGISENEFRKQMGYAKSDSKYADMTSDERKANINKDIGTNGFAGVGTDRYGDKPTDNKVKE